MLVEASAGSILEVRFCNDGPAIPRADWDKIFQKFFGSEQGTAGIGLFFCRLAVAAHGGTIALEDRSDWPTCFVVRLPVATI